MAAADGSGVEDRQGCQARNSKKNNNNVTQTRAFQLKRAVCWAVLWLLRNVGLVSPGYPSWPWFPQTRRRGVRTRRCQQRGRAAAATGAGACVPQLRGFCCWF